jgi:N4-gp56 family major capsid protein
MPLNYNAPIDASKSSIDGSGSDGQMNTFFYMKKAIITARKEQYFMPLASVTNMPKNYGKTIKVFEYVPLLDDRNANDQGINASGVTIADGNLYGSSTDIGTITTKLPSLTENGGRVNRVGFTRLTREGSIHKFGFFTEFTQEALDFDSDEELMDHLSTELMNGAVQMTEAVLQKDLVLAAGAVLFAGAATDDDEITGEVVSLVPASIVTYANLMRLDQILTDNRTPKATKVISGSRLQDTKVIAAARFIFVGSELVPLLKGLTDLFGNKAFVEVQHYADAGTIMNGEIGSIDAFRFIQVPEMLSWAGAGAAVGTNPGYRSTTVSSVDHYDVFPMLVIGDDSFTTIGFQTDGKSVKFSVMTKMPGKETADRNDPYGETGFSSIKWYYGILIKRPERIGIIKTVAPI